MGHYETIWDLVALFKLWSEPPECTYGLLVKGPISADLSCHRV